MASGLSLEELRVGYDEADVLSGVSLLVRPGEITCILGVNGAGKSTLIRAILSLTPPRSGRVLHDGEEITGWPTHRIISRGIACIPEGRKVFPKMTVQENLLIGGQSRRAGPWTLTRVYELFPVLAERRNLPAPALSGGQQQMAAIGRALMSNPRLLLCDEISLGLAPIVVRDIYARLPQITAEGLSLVIVEQDIVQALRAASHVYCLQEGRVALQGAARDLTREKISAAYFGV